MMDFGVKNCASVFSNPNTVWEVFWLLNEIGRYKSGSEGLTQGEYP